MNFLICYRLYRFFQKHKYDITNYWMFHLLHKISEAVFTKDECSGNVSTQHKNRTSDAGKSELYDSSTLKQIIISYEL